MININSERKENKPHFSFHFAVFEGTLKELENLNLKNATLPLDKFLRLIKIKGHLLATLVTFNHVSFLHNSFEINQ